MSATVLYRKDGREIFGSPVRFGRNLHRNDRTRLLVAAKLAPIKPLGDLLE